MCVSVCVWCVCLYVNVSLGLDNLRASTGVCCVQHRALVRKVMDGKDQILIACECQGECGSCLWLAIYWSALLMAGLKVLHAAASALPQPCKHPAWVVTEKDAVPFSQPLLFPYFVLSPFPSFSSSLPYILLCQCSMLQSLATVRGFRAGQWQRDGVGTHCVGEK